MLRRIKTLKNIGRFQQLHSARGDEGNFAQLNVIYALNASGKSTLCDLIRSLGTGEPAYIVGRARFGAQVRPEAVLQLESADGLQSAVFREDEWQQRAGVPPIHVFDERFVAENVLVGHHVSVEQRRRLFGLVIGEVAIELHEAVAAANERLATATTAEQETKTELARYMAAGETLDDFRGIHQIGDVDAELERAEAALERAKRVHRKAEDVRLRRPLSPVPVAVTPADLDAVLATTLSDAMRTAEATVRAHLDEHSNGLDLAWARRGHSAQSGIACPHCGQSMDGLAILDAYQALFSGELEAQEARLKDLEVAVDRNFGPEAQARTRRDLDAHLSEQQWWRDAAEVALELPGAVPGQLAEESMARVHAALRAAIARKRSNPVDALALEDAERVFVHEWEQLAGQLVTYNAALGAANERIKEEQAAAEQADLAPLEERVAACRASIRRFAPGAIAALHAFDVAAAERAAAQTAKTEANTALRTESEQLFADYGQRINDLLRRFRTDIQIVPGTVRFSGGQPSGELTIAVANTPISVRPQDAADPSVPSLANTLSSGDRSALALAFFLAKVEADPRLAESVVVFDDPFHSQDRSRRHRTVERIQAVARTARQCFVLSHDLEFARHVEQTHSLATRAFVLEALAEQSTLECVPLPALPSRAYEVNYMKLVDYLADPASFQDRLNDVAGSLRRVLEEYLQLKFPHCWTEGGDWLGVMIGRIRAATGEDPLVRCQGLVDDLTEVNEYSQRFHHRSAGATTDVPDPRELTDYVDQTLSIIQR